MTAGGTLYLLPCDLGAESSSGSVLPESVLQTARGLTHFIAENPKSARAFLKRIAHPLPLQGLHIATLDKHTHPREIHERLAPLRNGVDAALLSEAGCPAVADPGALLVREAHATGIPVAPLVGPSAILLALMACGLNGQRFAFQGYLPVEKTARAQRIKALEKRSRTEDCTQIFIEAPYRNNALLRALIEQAMPQTWLCVATDLTQPGQQIITRRIGAWRTAPVDIDRRPAVFLLYAGR